MHGCSDTPLDMLELLQGRLPPEGRARLEDHAMVCEDCAEESTGLREAWQRLPTSVDARPPRASRERILSYAAADLERAGTEMAGLAMPRGGPVGEVTRHGGR